MSEMDYWVAWNLVGGVGPRRFSELLARFGSAEAAWQAPYRSVSEVYGMSPGILREWQKLKAQADIEAFIRNTTRTGVRILTLNDPDYPRNLKELHDAPPVLYVRGSVEECDSSAIAIVGSRTPTPGGAVTAERFAAELAAQGITVVSGLARGIDTAAHMGALAAGGRTIGILGSGIDIIYPKENTELVEVMAKSGAVVSEFCPGTLPVSHNFPIRNRVISGLSLGVLVVEAAHDSGSLITAGHAADQGREVFAIPGIIGSELGGGPNRLIKQGAKLVEKIEDILEELNLPVFSTPQAEPVCRSAELDEDERRLITLLGFAPQHLDDLVRGSGLEAAAAAGALLNLELKGLIRQLPGKLFCRTR